MMNGSLLEYGPLVVVGMMLGAIFFGGLWITVRRMPNAKHPVLLFLTSVVLRTAIALAGFWYFSNGDPWAIIVCLVGFVGVRLLATHGVAMFGITFGRKEAH